MSKTIVGDVAVATEKELKSGTYYSFCVDDEWYRTGKKNSGVLKGNRVKFNYTEDKYGKHVDLPSLQIKEGEVSATPKATEKSGKTDWAAKDKKISYMAAAKLGIQAVIAATESDYLGIPKSKKPAEKLAMFLAQCDEVTEHFFRNSETVPERYDDIMSGGESAPNNDFDAELKEIADDFEEDAPEEEEDW